MTLKRKTSTPDSAEAFMPETRSLTSLRQAAASCKACDLWKLGTQTVFGEGSRSADVMFVGEQPGNEEDLAGKPFVGPAGRLLDKALKEAGIDRSRAYLTNIVKHFKWERRGKRRIHQKPNTTEVRACRPWFEAELFAVKPSVVVCLGATAAQALLGKEFKVTQERGRIIRSNIAPVLLATVHPSSILRAPDSETREAEFRRLIEDLRNVVRYLRESKESKVK
jgi:uracil-DNA glycosylase family protein